MPTITATTTMLLLVFFLSTAAAQSPASAPESVGVAAAPGPASGKLDCTTYLYNMVDCLSYVQKGSNLTQPEKPCCGELADLIKAQPICICELLSNSTASIGVEVDVPRSLKLQTLCKVDAPSASLCSVAGYPVAGVPSYSPLSPGMAPEGAAPSNSEKGENGANSRLSLPPFFLVCYAIALFLPTFFSI